MAAKAGVFVLLIFVIAAVVDGVGAPARFLTLERAFPANETVNMEVLRSRDRARHARILQGVVDLDVFGASDVYVAGLYYTKLRLGSPPKEYNVQIDTGSDILWITCSSCTDCPQTSGLGVELNLYDIGSSSTASLVSCSNPICNSMVQTNAAGCITQGNQCGYSFEYGDGSGTTGHYVTDLLYFDTILGPSVTANSSAPIVFGCSSYQSGDLTKTDRALDGIIGFGQQDLSVMSQLSALGITPKVFSHCLKGEGKGGGILVLGEILDPTIVYTPLVPSQPHYNLNLLSIAVGGQLLSVDPVAFATSSNRGTIVDSGTTLTYLVAEAYDPFVDTVTAGVSQYATPMVSKGSQCYLVSSSINEIFPLVAFNFEGGASIVLKPTNYMMDMGFVDGAPLWCIGFQKAQDQAVTILGDLVLKDKIFIYDLSRQRIGWADYDCSSSVNVSITSSKDEFVNAGQLHSSSSSRNTLLHLLQLSSCGFFFTFLYTRFLFW